MLHVYLSPGAGSNPNGGCVFCIAPGSCPGHQGRFTQRASQSKQSHLVAAQSAQAGALPCLVAPLFISSKLNMKYKVI
jgi:hypothetical protein